MSQRHTVFGSRLREEYEKRGYDFDQIRLDAQIDAAISKHNRIDFVANNLAMIALNDRAILKAAMMRLTMMRLAVQEKGGLGGHVGSASNGHASTTPEPLTDDEAGGHAYSTVDDGQVVSAHASSHQGDGTGHCKGASNGQTPSARPSSHDPRVKPEEDGEGQGAYASNGQPTVAPPSQSIRGAGAIPGVPEGLPNVAPAAANLQRPPSRAALRAAHRAEMRTAKFVMRLPDNKDITEIKLGEAAYYETKTADSAVINYVMKVLRRDYAAYDQSKFLGSDEEGAVPLISLQRIIKDAQEAVYGHAA